MSQAAVTDVTVRMGREASSFTPVQVSQMALLLDDAEALLIARIPTLLTQIVSLTGPATLENVIRVEAMAVKRVMLNPGSFSNETIDGWSGSRDQALSAGLLYIMPSEWTMLFPTNNNRLRGSIPLIANDQYPPWYYGTTVSQP